MRDPTTHAMQALGASIAADWDAGRGAAVMRSIRRRERQRRLVWLPVSALVLAATTAVGALTLRWNRETMARVAARASTPDGTSAAPAAPWSRPVETVDAPALASATPLVEGTDLAPGPDGGGRSFVLRAGKARFVVPHDPARPFCVEARSLLIEDLGTVFTVAVASDGMVAVDVSEGSVRVHRGNAVFDVLAGQQRNFYPEPPSAETSQPQEGGPASLPRWRTLAARGLYDDAFQALRALGPGAVHDEATDLLVAADAARFGGHPAEAVPYLQRVVGAHGRDPRASLAAFTLGRVLLDELGRPAEAADAFERARAAGGVMGEDALAREVEAWSRAGDAARAHDLAALYAQRYPAGRRARTVAKFGGAP
jgi:ferric-dicitrate binding protein FerR (iron transport regulator)